jgi:hypothetical protein
MRKLPFLAISCFIVLSFLLSACRCPSCYRQEETVVPHEILIKTNNFIIQRTGKDFFEKYITPDFVKTKYVAPYFNMVYRFVMPDKSYVNELIEFSVDTLGNIVRDRDIVGIPNCIDADCSFNITEEQVIKIAKDNGLQKGIKDWKTGLIWDAKLKQYVWHILSTDWASEGPQGFRGSGKEVIIDPNTGLILAMNDWHVN